MHVCPAHLYVGSSQNFRHSPLCINEALMGSATQPLNKATVGWRYIGLQQIVEKWLPQSFVSDNYNQARPA